MTVVAWFSTGSAAVSTRVTTAVLTAVVAFGFTVAGFLLFDD